MERLVSPSHLFLGLSFLSTLVGLVHVVAPEFALQLEGLPVNLLDNEVTHVLYRSYGCVRPLGSLNPATPHSPLPARC